MNGYEKVLMANIFLAFFVSAHNWDRTIFEEKLHSYLSSLVMQVHISETFNQCMFYEKL